MAQQLYYSPSLLIKYTLLQRYTCIITYSKAPKMLDIWKREEVFFCGFYCSFFFFFLLSRGIQTEKTEEKTVKCVNTYRLAKQSEKRLHKMHGGGNQPQDMMRFLCKALSSQSNLSFLGKHVL